MHYNLGKYGSLSPQSGTHYHKMRLSMLPLHKQFQ